uniref:Phosphoribosylformylglycinamidine synthase n=1 Tax=Apteryx owenii TaxID=8824 RepID=A0A8B9QFU4_APTOW
FGCHLPHLESGLAAALAGGLVALRYADDEGRPTAEYPLNPNGAAGAAAGLCSPCGRHLALMPHPERAVRPWQWPWWPSSWPRRPTAAAPWLRMFQNACEWCLRFPHGEA